jgi:hypothetical protein
MVLTQHLSLHFSHGRLPQEHRAQRHRLCIRSVQGTPHCRRRLPIRSGCHLFCCKSISHVTFGTRLWRSTCPPSSLTSTAPSPPILPPLSASSSPQRQVMPFFSRRRWMRPVCAVAQSELCRSGQLAGGAQSRHDWFVHEQLLRGHGPIRQPRQTSARCRNHRQEPVQVSCMAPPSGAWRNVTHLQHYSWI